MRYSTHPLSERGEFRLGIAILALFGSCGALGTAQHFDRESYQVKVVGSERVVSGDKYVVFTQDVDTGKEGAFENTDSLIECLFDNGCKFDSSTLQAQLISAEKSNTVCEIRTYGWRVPFLSMYENIVAISNCKSPK
ncbi:MAG: DUF1523 family protein [Nanoarchaeota archaeon]